MFRTLPLELMEEKRFLLLSALHDKPYIPFEHLSIQAGFLPFFLTFFTENTLPYVVDMPTLLRERSIISRVEVTRPLFGIAEPGSFSILLP
jgi:hypothetical protein